MLSMAKLPRKTEIDLCLATSKMHVAKAYINRIPFCDIHIHVEFVKILCKLECKPFKIRWFYYIVPHFKLPLIFLMS